MPPPRRTTPNCWASSRPPAWQVNSPNRDAFIAASKAVYDDFAQEVLSSKDIIDRAIALGEIGACGCSVCARGSSGSWSGSSSRSWSRSPWRSTAGVIFAYSGYSRGSVWTRSPRSCWPGRRYRLSPLTASKRADIGVAGTVALAAVRAARGSSRALIAEAPRSSRSSSFSSLGSGYQALDILDNGHAGVAAVASRPPSRCR